MQCRFQNRLLQCVCGCVEGVDKCLFLKYTPRDCLQSCAMRYSLACQGEGVKDREGERKRGKEGGREGGREGGDEEGRDKQGGHRGRQALQWRRGIK